MDMTNRFRALSALCAAAAIAATGVMGASGQNWDRDDGYYRPPEQSQWPPYGQSGGGQQPVYGQSGYSSAGIPGYVSPRCHELEVQLTGGAAPNSDQLPKIEADMRQADADFRKAQGDADRGNCYEDMFLFGRSLRRTPRCIELDQQVQTAKSTLAQLKAQRDAIMRGSSIRGRHDDLVAELARNHCGDQYVREYEAQRNRSSSIFSFFSNEESDDSSRYTPSYGASAYRTLCVRECDGFYFPISTATSENQFQEDDAKCRSQCAAPAELYYHRTDQDVEQMVSLRGVPYSQTPTAFRNRKVYIRGCSCNANEYSREEIAKSEEALKTAKRADAGAAKPQGASDAAFARRISQAVQNAPSQPQPAPEKAGAATTVENAPSQPQPAPEKPAAAAARPAVTPPAKAETPAPADEPAPSY
jgi:Protein of unknown function (DUF2865)